MHFAIARPFGTNPRAVRGRLGVHLALSLSPCRAPLRHSRSPSRPLALFLFPAASAAFGDVDDVCEACLADCFEFVLEEGNFADEFDISDEIDINIDSSHNYENSLGFSQRKLYPDIQYYP